jgi:hypothetical protein
MAALSVMTDLPPRWIKQNGHWVENSSSKSSSRSTSNESMNTSPVIQDTNVLVNILNVLQKMDSKMELQAKRLEILEMTGSPASSSGETTLLNETPISRGQTVRTASSKRTSDVSEAENSEGANEYARSVLKIKEFLDEAVSVMDSEHPEEVLMPEEPARQNFKATGKWADLIRPQTPDVDLYSVSMYSGDLLGESKMSLGLSHHLEHSWMPMPPSQRTPPSPPRSESEDEEEGDMRSTITNELAVMDEEKEHQAINEDNADPIIEEVNTAADPQPDRLRKRISINITETKTCSPYIKIELGFYAFDSWKRGVLSKIKNESQALWKQEQVRFNDLRHTTYQAMDRAHKGLAKMRSALEREWIEEKERLRALRQPGTKKGVKIFRWRIAISFRDVVQVNREPSIPDVVC